MGTEEKDESQSQQPSSQNAVPNTPRENTDQDSAVRRPYNQGYNRPDGNNYERRPYNRPNNDRGGYNSYGDNRPYHPHYDNNGGGYNRPYNNNGGNRSYGSSREGDYNNRPSYGNRPYNNNSYGNDRPQYNNDRSYNNDRPYNNDRSYNNGGGQYNNNGYNRPQRPSYDDRGKAYSATPSGDVTPTDNNMRKRRPRVGDSRVNYDSRDNRSSRPSYGGGDNRSSRPSYGGGDNGYGRPNNNPRYNNGGGGRGGYNNNRRPNNNYRQGNGDYNPNAKYNFQKQLKYKEVLADPNEPIRLNKFLSNAGVCSRREADEFIQAGAVKVNGEVVTELGTKITRQDNVLFNDKPVQIESKVYIVLNKPKNCVTTSDDPQERLTVMDLVKNACSERIYPVGRLDRNTTGVLLLTNDGDLASKLTHPSFKKKKIYHVWLDKNVSVEDMEKIANGMELEDGEIHADAISYASEDDKSQVGIEIHSGRNRIVRRIFESLGYHVVKLDRVYFAGLTKKNLGRGKWRYLNEREVNALRMGAFE